MTCLMGDTEKRVVYDGFELLNLNSNAHDHTHELYQKYLETKYFVVPGERAYWAHMTNNVLPGTPSSETAKGLFNVFPLCLDSDELHSRTSRGSNMGESPGRRKNTPPPIKITMLCAGVVSSSPLKIELEFEPRLDYTWYLCYTFQTTHAISFTGNRHKQECLVSQIR
jgi:hypothetical protein